MTRHIINFFWREKKSLTFFLLYNTQKKKNLNYFLISKNSSKILYLIKQTIQKE